MNKTPWLGFGKIKYYFGKKLSCPLLFKAFYTYFRKRKITLSCFLISLILFAIGIVWLRNNYFEKTPEAFIDLNQHSENFKVKHVLVILNANDHDFGNKQTLRFFVTIESNLGTSLFGEEVRIGIPKDFVYSGPGLPGREVIEGTNEFGHYLDFKITSNVDHVDISGDLEGNTGIQHFLKITPSPSPSSTI